MASIDSVGLAPVGPTPSQSEPAPHVSLDLRHDDVRRVRLYSRISAALKALALFLIVLAAAWLGGRWLDAPWLDDPYPRLVIVAALLAAARFAIAELRLRTYDVRLEAGAVTFAYGRKHFYLPIAHLQLIDTESSPLLRPMGLGRCVLHTAGGMVSISPVPVRFVSAIEREMFAQRTDHANAN